MTYGFTEEQQNSGKYFFAQYQTDRFRKKKYDESCEWDKDEYVKMLRHMDSNLKEYVFSTLPDDVRLYIDVGLMIGEVNSRSATQGRFLLSIRWMDLGTKKYHNILTNLSQRQYCFFVSMFDMTYMGY